MNCLLADMTWWPGFNDPDPMGWCVTVAHLTVSLLCFFAGKRSRQVQSEAGGDPGTSIFWYSLAAVMLGLGLNKQLDLHTLLTMIGREIAKRDGWYNQRRQFQLVFVIACAAIGLTCTVASLYVIRGRWRQCGLAFLGIVFLLTFIVIRAASFHHVDKLIYGLPFVENRVNAGLELAGSLMVCLGAFLASRGKSVPPLPLKP